MSGRYPSWHHDCQGLTFPGCSVSARPGDGGYTVLYPGAANWGVIVVQDKPVQIRPWKLSDADFVLDASLPLDPRFVLIRSALCEISSSLSCFCFRVLTYYAYYPFEVLLFLEKNVKLLPAFLLTCSCNLQTINLRPFLVQPHFRETVLLSMDKNDDKR